MLLDSNVIVYAFQVAHADRLRSFIEDDPVVSAISYVEVLGYHGLTADDRRDFEEFFSGVVVLPLSAAVLDRAVGLRQARKMGLGDALVAATALTYSRTLVTRNSKDFTRIDGLEVVNPFAAG